MQILVLRVYRRNSRGCWGVLEDAQNGRVFSFQTARQLLALLRTNLVHTAGTPRVRRARAGTAGGGAG